MSYLADTLWVIGVIAGGAMLAACVWCAADIQYARITGHRTAIGKAVSFLFASVAFACVLAQGALAL